MLCQLFELPSSDITAYHCIFILYVCDQQISSPINYKLLEGKEHASVSHQCVTEPAPF